MSSVPFHWSGVGSLGVEGMGGRKEAIYLKKKVNAQRFDIMEVSKLSESEQHN